MSRIRWHGHGTCREDKKNAYEIAVGKSEEKRQFGDLEVEMEGKI
jgi:hypothetical protein